MPDTAMPRGAFRLDGLADALAPFAGRNAADRAGFFGSVAAFASLGGDLAAELAYAEGGLAATIVDRPADDAVSRGFECEGDERGDVADEWSRLDAAPVMADALRYAFRDGAAAVLVLCEDGPSLAEPLREDRIGAILGLRPLSGARLSAGPYRYADPAHPRYGEPTTYRVRDASGGEYEAHETRLLRVPGEPMAASNGGGRGSSVSATLSWAGRPRLGGNVAEDLRRYQQGLRWLLTLLERKQQPVHAADGLAEMLAAADTERRVALAAGLAVPADDAYAVVRARARSVDMTRGTLGTVMVDGKDKFSVLDLDLSGVGEVVREFKIALASSTRTPVSILFGESAKGLNATGENDFEGWYGHVAQVQNRCLRPALERLTRLIFRQDAFRAREPERWRVVFSPLWQPSDAERAETAERRARAVKAEADALAVLADLGIATPEELRDAARNRVPGWGLPAAAAPGAVPDDAGEADAATVEGAAGSAGIAGTPRAPARNSVAEPAASATRTATLTVSETNPAGGDGTAPVPA